MTKRFSASSAAQLMACPGSANLEAAIPGFTEPVRDDMAGAKGIGTRLHDVLREAVDTVHDLYQLAELIHDLQKIRNPKRAKLITDEIELETWIDKSLTQSGAPGMAQATLESYANILGKLEEFTPIMLRFVAVALDYVQAEWLRASGNGSHPQIALERRYIAEWLDSRPPTTPDVVLYDFESHRLDVFDYKSGKIPVSPVENSQLMFYARCALQDYPNAQTIVLHILQPGSLQAWETDTRTIMEWAERARKADQAILNGDLTLQPSDHCTFCPANPHSRGDKNPPYCGAMLNLLYPPVYDDDAIFDLM